MNLQVLAHNVKRLRKANPQFATQGALAKAASLPLHTIAGIERGTKTPDHDEVLKIANALKLRRVYMLHEEPRALQAVCYRSGKPKLAYERYAQEILHTEVARWLFDFAAVEELLNDKQPFLLKPAMQEKAKGGSPAAVAGWCREILAVADHKPIDDIFALLEKAGVKVFATQTAPANFFGFAVSEADGGPAVVVNVSPSIPVARWIFSAAHELGHIVMHSDAKNNSQDKELEANQFATHFLMPDGKPISSNCAIDMQRYGPYNGRLRELVIRAAKKQVITRSRAAEILGMGVGDMCVLLGAKWMRDDLP